MEGQKGLPGAGFMLAQGWQGREPGGQDVRKLASLLLLLAACKAQTDPGLRAWGRSRNSRTLTMEKSPRLAKIGLGG